MCGCERTRLAGLQASCILYGVQPACCCIAKAVSLTETHKSAHTHTNMVQYYAFYFYVLKLSFIFVFVFKFFSEIFIFGSLVFVWNLKYEHKGNCIASMQLWLRHASTLNSLVCQPSMQFGGIPISEASNQKWVRQCVRMSSLYRTA